MASRRREALIHQVCLFCRRALMPKHRHYHLRSDSAACVCARCPGAELVQQALVEEVANEVRTKVVDRRVAAKVLRAMLKALEDEGGVN
jgi:hypothetical protein